MLKLMVMFTFSVLGQKYPFQANLVQKIKFVSLRRNLGPTTNDKLCYQKQENQGKLDKTRNLISAFTYVMSVITTSSSVLLGE